MQERENRSRGEETQVSPGIDAWSTFHAAAERFERQRLACDSGLAFAFTEGALVDAIRTGKWYVALARSLVLFSRFVNFGLH